MRRASYNITLVLISASLIVYGCGEQGGTEYVVNPVPAGTEPQTLPGTPTTYHYDAPYYYAQRPAVGESGASGTATTHAAAAGVTRSGYYGGRSIFSSGSSSYRSSSGGWGSGSTVKSSGSHSPSVSRGGFGSTGSKMSTSS